MRAISLLSGGLDSLVATWATAREHEVVLALTFDYGQRAAGKELRAAAKQAEALGAKHRAIKLPWLGELGGNALTDRSQPLPRLDAGRLDDLAAATESAAGVWVPNRNGVFLGVAGAFADALGCELIVCGFNAEEGATFPDNTPEFMRATDAALALSTQVHARVHSPTVELTKSEIVELGRRIQTPMGLVWSCYEGGVGHCGECESCKRLARALGSLPPAW
jgi:7-cyano-7-deazaguanine synthase